MPSHSPFRERCWFAMRVSMFGLITSRSRMSGLFCSTCLSTMGIPLQMALTKLASKMPSPLIQAAYVPAVRDLKFLSGQPVLDACIFEIVCTGKATWVVGVLDAVPSRSCFWAVVALETTETTSAPWYR